MKSTSITKTITMNAEAQTVALCISMLNHFGIYGETPKRIVRTLAAYYGLTCSS